MSAFPKFQVKRDTVAKVAKPANSAETRNGDNQESKAQIAKLAKVAKPAATASRAPALSASTANPAPAPVAPALAVTEPTGPCPTCGSNHFWLSATGWHCWGCTELPPHATTLCLPIPAVSTRPHLQDVPAIGIEVSHATVHTCP